MVKKALKIFNLGESLGGGGTYFADGPYRIEQARFVEYDFNGHADATNCLMLKLQPLDKNGKDSGDEVVQYWATTIKGKEGDTVILNKGKSIGVSDSNEHGTIWARTAYGVFMTNLAKAEFDMDAHEDEDDITVLEGVCAEFSKVVEKADNRKAKDDDNKDGKKKTEYETIVITSILKSGKSSSGSKSSSKEETKSKGSSKKDKDSNDPEEIVSNFLAEYLDGKEGTIKGMQARMAMGKTIDDPDVVKAAVAKFQDKKFLTSILTTLGWELDGTDLKKSE